MTNLLALLIFSFSGPAHADKVGTLLSESDWEVAGHGEHDVLGQVVLSTKDVGGDTCLKGTATVQASAATMLAVVEDVDGALSWSKAGLTATEVLQRDGARMKYYQHLDVPGWTMAADRYWVLESQTSAAADGARIFQWDRFDWRAEFPELAARLDRDHPKAIEPEPNFGAWAFHPAPGGTEVRYYMCTASGNIPEWLQKAAATKTLPGAMADVVVEARRRDG